jgi:hypothetical protein
MSRQRILVPFGDGKGFREPDGRMARYAAAAQDVEFVAAAPS